MRVPHRPGQIAGERLSPCVCITPRLCGTLRRSGSAVGGADSALLVLEIWTVVKLRMKRFGRRNHPFYRLCAMDIRSPRDGRAIEELGTYDPRNPDASKQFDCKADRVKYWLSQGAQPSDTVRGLLKKASIDPTPGQKLA